jgi:putative transcriptional regulator
MAVEHHPSAASLLAYMATELAAGAALVVATHIELCPRCAEMVRALENDGRVAVDIAPGEANDTLSRGPPRPLARQPISGLDLPVGLAGLRVGRWWWAGPGITVMLVKGAAGLGEQLYLLKGRAGAVLPRHEHRGVEWVVVLKGAFAEGATRFRRGDISERGADEMHGLRVMPEEECICLVATDDQSLHWLGLRQFLAPLLKRR